MITLDGRSTTLDDSSNWGSVACCCSHQSTVAVLALMEGGDLFAVRLGTEPMGSNVVPGVEQLGPEQVPDKGVGESALLEANIADRPTSGPELAEQPCWKLTSCTARVGLASGEAYCKQALSPIQTMATTGWIICQNRVGRVEAPRRGRERRPRAHSQRGRAGLPQHPVY